MTPVDTRNRWGQNLRSQMWGGKGRNPWWSWEDLYREAMRDLAAAKAHIAVLEAEKAHLQKRVRELEGRDGHK